MSKLTRRRRATRQASTTPVLLKRTTVVETFGLLLGEHPTMSVDEQRALIETWKLEAELRPIDLTRLRADVERIRQQISAAKSGAARAAPEVTS